MRHKPTAERCADSFGCTIEQAKRILAKNADVLATMATKAERTSRRVNGYTAAQLRASETDYREAAQTPTLSMRDFFNLPEVQKEQEIQKANPYGSTAHRAAFDRLVQLGRTHGAENFFGGY